MKKFRAVCLVLSLVSSLQLAGVAASFRQQQLFDAGWQFHLGEVSGAQQPALDVSTWRRIDLPHDWSAEGEFSKTNASCTGFLPGGIGWYRKSFNADASWLGRKIFVTFDGVYRNSEVWINGHSLGQRAYGYSTFQLDLTPFLVTNSPNVLAVRVEREDVADSRWYPGSGIYRHVWLTVTPQVHVPLWGNYITTPRANADAADVVVRTEVTNETAAAHSVRVAWQIQKPDGTLLPEQSQTHELPANNGETFELWQKVSAPALWSLETPVLHTLVSRVFVDGELADETRTPFGIRTFGFDANNGISLNGKSIKLKGLCMHHDAGVVGAAVPDDMLARRLQLVKEIGGNAIRCSHNPMAPELYDLCDRLGLLVMDEAFDEWEIGKRKWVEGRNEGTAGRFGYSQDFRAWAERDAADMVRRDRNHPSIVMWSIGNEIDYPTDPYVLPETRTVEGFAQDSKLPQQTRLAVVAPKLIAAVKRQDPTRPVTMALANMVSSDATGLAQMLDVVGYNYQEQDYARDHQAFPTRVIYGSENGRGVGEWRAVTDNAYVGGQFLWVGFDFLGEADKWPNHGSQAGLFDTRGFKKSAALQRQALWSDVPLISTYVALPGENGRRRGRFEPNWTLPQGTGRVRMVMFSNCDRAELRLNGKVIGSKKLGDDRSTSFETEYQPGELVSVGFRGDLAVATNLLVTAGEPTGVRFETDRSDLPADGRSVAHVVVSIVDDRGNLVYPARNPVTVSVEGAGRLLGVDNGDQNDTTALSKPVKVANGGQVLVVLQAGRNAGKITVKVDAPGLKSGQWELPVK